MEGFHKKGRRVCQGVVICLNACMVRSFVSMCCARAPSAHAHPSKRRPAQQARSQRRLHHPILAYCLTQYRTHTRTHLSNLELPW